MSVALTSGKVPVKILTADDHPLLREALARLIAEIGSPVEVLEADSLRGAEDLLAAHRDLALMILDVVLPDATGIEAVDRVLRARPDVPLLVVSAKDDPATARAVLDSGARGFISKRSPTRVLAEAIRLVLVGGTYLPPQVLGTAPPVGTRRGRSVRRPGSAELDRAHGARPHAPPVPRADATHAGSSEQVDLSHAAPRGEDGQGAHRDDLSITQGRQPHAGDICREPPWHRAPDRHSHDRRRLCARRAEAVSGRYERAISSCTRARPWPR